MNSPRNYIIRRVGIENYKDFLNFAFGENFSEDTDYFDIPKMWNAKHPDVKFYLYDNIFESLDLMVKKYLEKKPLDFTPTAND